MPGVCILWIRFSEPLGEHRYEIETSTFHSVIGFTQIECLSRSFAKRARNGVSDKTKMTD